MKIFESAFPDDFRKTEIKSVLDCVTTGKFCQLICIPGAGKATILRLLAHNRSLLRFHLGEKEKNLRFVYLNLLELSELTDTQILRFLIVAMDQDPKSLDDQLILTKQLSEEVNKLSDLGQTLIFLLDHFDEFQNQLPRFFFQTLKNLKNIAKYKFSVVFATRRDLSGLVDEEILKEYWDFFIGNTIYLKIFEKSALNHLFAQIEAVFSKKLKEDEKSKITKITGGHAKLTKIAADLILGQNVDPTTNQLLKNHQIQAALYEIWLFLTGVEQQTLLTITQGKTPSQIDETLINLDLISYQNKITIPIFEEFIKTTKLNLQTKIVFDAQTNEIKKGESIISELLSPQEYRLLKFLIENPKKVLDRDQIIKAVWPQTQSSEAISDEAIDQMVFRLRKKIEDEPAKPVHIQTVKGRGLKFEP